MEIIDYLSPNYNERAIKDGILPDILVIHTMSMGLKESLEYLTFPSNEVSSHYVISEQGLIYRLVSEEFRAWHCGTGRSSWRGKDDLNSFSIGIELIHSPSSLFYPSAQIEALIKLSKDILNRFPIPSRNIIGHSDISPGRKVDPIFPFPWKALALEGIGLWTDDFISNDNKAENMLKQIGYCTKDLKEALKSFQMHFLPDNLTGEEDEKTLKRLYALTKLL